MKCDKPLVSIVIPVYNGANYLGEAIDSALAQTYPNIEILVINDGSIDNEATERIAHSYGNRIRYYAKENGGVASALNMGIQKMRGEYFSWLSHDDIYLPNKVEREVEYLLSHGNQNTIVFSAYQTIDQNGNVIDNYNLPESVYTNILGLISIDTERTLNGCSMLIPKTILDNDQFDETLRYTQDYDLWLRLSKKANFIYLDEYLFQSRQHPEQDSRSGGERVLLEADRYRSRSISELSPQRALDYVENDIGRLEYIAKSYQANGYAASYLSVQMLIIKCRILCDGIDEESAWKKFLNVQELNESHNWYVQAEDKPTLVIYNNVWTYGGIERVMSLLIPEFEKRFRVVLITNYVDDEKGYPLPERTVHLTLKQTNGLSLPERIAVICKLTHAEVLLGNPNIVEQFLPVYKLLFLLGIKTIALNHYYYFLPEMLPWLHSVSEMRHDAFKYANAVVWLTNFNATMCESRCDHVAVIPNPNTFSFSETRTYPKQKQIIVVGRFFDSLKRIDRIMQVFGEVYKRDRSVKLIVLGNCHNLDDSIPTPVGMSIRTAMESAHIPEKTVIFAGEQADVKPYYKSASVLLMCSECEGFPMVLTEACVFGVPVVVYRTPGLEDIIINGENGRLIMDEKPEVAAESIFSIINDEQEWLRLSRNAQILSQRFTINKVVQKWNDLFELLETQEPTCFGKLLRESGLGCSDTFSKQNISAILNHHETVFRNLLSLENQHRSLEDQYRKLKRQNGEPFLENISDQSSITNNNEAISLAKERVDKARSLKIEQEEREYQKRIAEMLQSKSWRITAPLRMIKKPLAKIGIEKESLFESDTVSAKQKWEAMQNSRSWRITKPMRLLKKGVLSLKNEGFLKTMVKVRGKIIH